jgi:hypothetical protein
MTVTFTFIYIYIYIYQIEVYISERIMFSHYCNYEQEVEHTTVEAELQLPAERQVNASVPAVPDDKTPATEHEMEPVQIDSTTENVFQEVFLEDCSTDVFFPEQCPDDTTQANGNNLDESSSR